MISRHFVGYIQSDEDDGDVLCILKKKKKIGVLITVSKFQQLNTLPSSGLVKPKIPCVPAENNSTRKKKKNSRAAMATTNKMLKFFFFWGRH